MHDNIVEEFSDNGTVRCYTFAREYEELLEDISGTSNVTWFSNKAHFDLTHYRAYSYTKIAT
jgi:hypothetical protein